MSEKKDDKDKEKDEDKKEPDKENIAKKHDPFSPDVTEVTCAPHKMLDMLTLDSHETPGTVTDRDILNDNEALVDTEEQTEDTTEEKAKDKAEDKKPPKPKD